MTNFKGPHLLAGAAEITCADYVVYGRPCCVVKKGSQEDPNRFLYLDFSHGLEMDFKLDVYGYFMALPSLGLHYCEFYEDKNLTSPVLPEMRERITNKLTGAAEEFFSVESKQEIIGISRSKRLPGKLVRDPSGNEDYQVELSDQTYHAAMIYSVLRGQIRTTSLADEATSAGETRRSHHLRKSLYGPTDDSYGNFRLHLPRGAATLAGRGFNPLTPGSLTRSHKCVIMQDIPAGQHFNCGMDLTGVDFLTQVEVFHNGRLLYNERQSSQPDVFHKADYYMYTAHRLQVGDIISIVVHPQQK